MHITGNLASILMTIISMMERWQDGKSMCSTLDKSRPNLGAKQDPESNSFQNSKMVSPANDELRTNRFQTSISSDISREAMLY